MWIVAGTANMGEFAALKMAALIGVILSSFYRTFTFLSKLLGTLRTPHALHHTHTQIAA